MKAWIQLGKGFGRMTFVVYKYCFLILPGMVLGLCKECRAAVRNNG